MFLVIQSTAQDSFRRSKTSRSALLPPHELSEFTTFSAVFANLELFMPTATRTLIGQLASSWNLANTPKNYAPANHRVFLQTIFGTLIFFLSFPLIRDRTSFLYYTLTIPTRVSPSHHNSPTHRRYINY